jgi:hypothetical protein
MRRVEGGRGATSEEWVLSMFKQTVRQGKEKRRSSLQTERGGDRLLNRKKEWKQGRRHRREKQERKRTPSTLLVQRCLQRLQLLPTLWLLQLARDLLGRDVRSSTATGERGVGSGGVKVAEGGGAAETCDRGGGGRSGRSVDEGEGENVRSSAERDATTSTRKKNASAQPSSIAAPPLSVGCFVDV